MICSSPAQRAILCHVNIFNVHYPGNHMGYHMGRVLCPYNCTTNIIYYASHDKSRIQEITLIDWIDCITSGSDVYSTISLANNSMTKSNLLKKYFMQLSLQRCVLQEAVLIRPPKL